MQDWETSKQHYDAAYRGPETAIPWNLGGPAPCLVEFVKRTGITSGKAFVPGCGLGYDALYLARQGLEVTAVDFSEIAVHRAKQAAHASGIKCNFVVSDFLELPVDFRGTFDLVAEVANLQSLEKRVRPKYAQALTEVLAPGGTLVVICLRYDPLRQAGFPRGLEVEAIARLVGARCVKMEARDTRLYNPDQDDAFLMAFRGIREASHPDT